MSTLIELTPEMMREIIMDHYSNPAHKLAPEQDGYLSTHSESINCIDNIDVFLKIGKGGLVEDARWTGVACAISTASTDIICDLLIGKSKTEALDIIDNYNKMIHEQPYNSEILEEALAFANTSKQAARIHCATIGWDAFKSIIEEHDGK